MISSLFWPLLAGVLCCLIVRFDAADLSACKNHQETIKHLYVEQSVPYGKGTTLKCLFGSTGKLVTLKWYVNETEFYRYEPADRSRSNVKIFKVRGVKIDESQTQFDPTKGSIIRLSNLTYASSGNYKCEVTTEPCFATAEKKRMLTVTTSRKKGYFERFGLNGALSSQPISSHYLMICFLLLYARLLCTASHVT